MKICTTCNRHFYDNLVDSTIVDGNLICEVCFYEQFGRYLGRSPLVQRPAIIRPPKPSIDTTRPHFMGALNVPNRGPYRVGGKAYGEVSVPVRKFGSKRRITYYPKADSYKDAASRYSHRDWRNLQNTAFLSGRDRSAVE